MANLTQILNSGGAPDDGGPVYDLVSAASQCPAASPTRSLEAFFPEVGASPEVVDHEGRSVTATKTGHAKVDRLGVLAWEWECRDGSRFWTEVRR